MIELMDNMNSRLNSLIAVSIANTIAMAGVIAAILLRG